MNVSETRPTDVHLRSAAFFRVLHLLKGLAHSDRDRVLKAVCQLFGYEARPLGFCTCPLVHRDHCQLGPNACAQRGSLR